MNNLLRRLFTRNRWFLLAVSVLLAGFQFLLCAVVTSVNIEGAVQQIMMFAPPVMKALIEQSLLGGTAAGILAFGWNHPITHAVLLAVAITLGSRAVAGEVENGAIELILAQPLSRAAYLTAQMVFGLGAILLVTTAGIVGTLVGERVFDLHAFGIDRVALLLINTILLQSAIFCITLLFSTIGREAGRVAMLAVIVALVSYFINVIASLWPKAAFLLPYSMHSYYDPRKILVEGLLPMSHVGLLLGVAAIGTGAAYARLQTRDLP